METEEIEHKGVDQGSNLTIRSDVTDEIIDIEVQKSTETSSSVRINYSTLQQDIDLAKIVKQFPCLYNKKDPGYKRNNDATNDAWLIVSKELDWVSTSIEACRLFEVLKKRYSKKKMNFKRAKYYSNSLEYIRRQEEELEKYQFMNWLEPFIRFRTVKLADDINETDDVDEYGDENGFETNTVYSEGGGRYYDGNVHEIGQHQAGKYRNVKRKSVDGIFGYSNAQAISHNSGLAKVSREDLKAATHRYSLPTQVSLSRKSDKFPAEEIHTLVKEIPSSSTSLSPNENSMVYHQSKVIEDEDNLFAAMIVMQLKGLNQRDKCLAKHEISNVLFKAQLKQLDEK